MLIYQLEYISSKTLSEQLKISYGFAQRILAQFALKGFVGKHTLKQGRKVVADLKKRHAKEILVKDVDGDGKDELYVAVEALTEGDRNNVQIVEPVEIRAM